MKQFHYYESHPGQYGGYSQTFYILPPGGDIAVKVDSYDEGPPGARPGDNIEEREMFSYSLDEFRDRYQQNQAVMSAFNAAKSAQ